MEKIIFFFILIFSCNTLSQDKALNQKERLSQYIGTWLSTDSLTDSQVGPDPKIKVAVTPIMDENSLQVVVFERQNDKWLTILVELISYDSVTDQIVASGQNKMHQCFIGKGYFDKQNRWFMKDINHKGEPSLNVSFDFISNTEVILKGEVLNKPNEGWQVKYIKANSKEKNIGIQLVSVKDAMQKDVAKTLNQLSRFGYSYIETFVYNDRMFYGMSPKAFKKVVQDNGLVFSGSMTFKSLPADSNWKSTMDWWKTCIEDHLDAGVSYITTSNNDIKSITTLKQLKKYCDYYNAVGKLCREKGLVFGFHNHADEFAKIEGEVVYDYLLKNTNHDYVSFQADLHWMKIAGVNPVDYFQKYPGRFFSWHVKDEAELGKSGTVNFENYYSYAKQAGLKFNVAEVEKYNYDPIKSVEMAYQYLFYANFVTIFR
jgi:sugar phosphate isomerase/epimerase